MLTLREKHEYEHEIAGLKAELSSIKKQHDKDNHNLRKSREMYKRKYLKLMQ